MNKAAELYERAAVCHQRAGESSKETEQKGWFELASIWLMLADSVSTRIEFGSAKGSFELAAEERST